MKHIKTYENNEEGCYIVTEIITGEEPILTVFKNKTSAENFAINIIHEYSTGTYNYKKIENVFDVSKLLEFWNDHNNSQEIYITYETYSEDVEIYDELKIRMNTNKYNL